MFRIAVVLSLLIPLSGFAETDTSRLRLAEVALVTGDYAMAERELLPLTSEKSDNRYAVTLLAETYWRSGQDKKLLNLTDKHYDGKEKDTWWCRVLERRGHADRAAKCWTMLGEEDRARRAMRAKVFAEEFSPGKTAGVRRD